MGQRNIDLNHKLWQQLAALSKQRGITRQTLIRDVLYTAVKRAAEGKDIYLEPMPRMPSSEKLPEMPADVRLVTIAGTTRYCRIDPETEFVIDESVVGDPRAMLEGWLPWHEEKAKL